MHQRGHDDPGAQHGAPARIQPAHGHWRGPGSHLPPVALREPGACSRRKKGRTRNMKRGDPIPRSRLDDFPCEKSLMVIFYAIKHLLKSFYKHIHTLRYLVINVANNIPGS